MSKNHLLIGSMCLATLFSPSYADSKKPVIEKKTEAVAKKDVSSASAPVAQISVRRNTELLDFLQKAYDSNPELLSNRYARNAKEAEMLAAMSRFGPNVRLSATAGHEVKPLVNERKNFADQLESLKDTKYDLNGQISASINLFKSGSDAFAVMSAAAKQEAYDMEQYSHIQKFILGAVEVYVDVMQHRQALEVYTKFERQARHNFERVQTEYEVGSSTRVNVLTAKAELAKSTSTRLKAQTDLINAEQAYVEMAGEPAGELIYPKNTLKLPTTFDECLKIAEEKSLALRSGAAGLRAARYGLASAITGVLPSVDLYADYTTSLNDTDLNNGGVGSVGIRFSYELFSNSGQGSHVSQIKQATNNKQAADYNHEHARSTMIKDVKAAWHGLKTAESQRTQADLGVAAARSAYDGALEEFRLGQRAYRELLEAQERLLKAELNYLDSVKAEILGRYKLLAAAGTLTPTAAGLVINERDDEDN